MTLTPKPAASPREFIEPKYLELKAEADAIAQALEKAPSLFRVRLYTDLQNSFSENITLLEKTAQQYWGQIDVTTAMMELKLLRKSAVDNINRHRYRWIWPAFEKYVERDDGDDYGSDDPGEDEDLYKSSDERGHGRDAN